MRKLKMNETTTLTKKFHSLIIIFVIVPLMNGSGPSDPLLELREQFQSPPPHRKRDSPISNFTCIPLLYGPSISSLYLRHAAKHSKLSSTTSIALPRMDHSPKEKTGNRCRDLREDGKFDNCERRLPKTGLRSYTRSNPREGSYYTWSRA